MNRLLFFFFCIIFFVAAKGQRTYAEAIKQGDEARDNRKFDIAINKYFAAEAFDPTKKDSVKAKLNMVFNRIEALRKEAEEAKKKAVLEKNNADIANREVSNTSDAFRLVLLAQEKVNDDPTIAMRIAEAAMQKHSDPLITNAAQQIFEQHDFYKIRLKDIAMRCAAISPDGTKVVTGGYDNKIGLWNIDGSLIRNFEEQHYPVMSVTFSPDGKKILTGGYDHIAKLWDTSGVLVREFAKQRNPIMFVAFSTDGKNILTVGEYNVAKLWDTSGALIREYSTDNETISSAFFSPDDKNIFTCTDQATWIWNENGSEKKRFGVKVISTAFSKNGERILIGYKNDTAGLFNFQEELLLAFKATAGKVVSVAFSPAGDKILTGSGNGDITLWDEDGNFIKNFKGSGAVLSIAFSKNGESFFTWSMDKTVKHWKTDKAMEGEFSLHSGGRPFTSIIFSPDGKNILTATEDKQLELWDINGTYRNKVIKMPDETRSIIFSPDGNGILVHAWDSSASLWSLAGNKITQFSGSCFSFSPGGHRILTGSRDGIVRLLNQEGNFVKEFAPRDTAAITLVSMSPYDGKILAGGNNSSVSLWNQDGALIWRIKLNDSIPFSNKSGEGVVKSVVFSPDKKHLLVGLSVPHTRGHYDKTFLVNMDGRPVKEVSGRQFVFSSDGKRILSVDGSSLKVFNSTGDLLSNYDVKGFVTAVFSADGNKIITGSDDGIIRTWDIALTMEEFLRSNQIEPLSAEQKKEYDIK